MGEHKVPWRAVFLDRDGVLNRAVVRNNLPYSPETLAELEILPGVAEACRLLKAAGFLLIVATNQPDVGRGKQSQVVIERMHDWLQRQLPLDRVEVCYHSGVVPCECRKPLPGLLVRVACELTIDLSESFMVGDRWRDIDCGHAAGCRTIFVDCGYAEALRTQPDYRVPNLLAAAHIILAAIHKKD